MMPVPAPILPTLPPGLPDDRGLGALLALVEGTERALPLRRVRVRAEIAGNCCRTVVEQAFANSYDDPLEAVHLFPLPEDGAVVDMELRAGEVVVRAECRERTEAEQVFDEARRAGHRAALLTAERADVHTLRVTNLPPREEVTVRIVVVEQLPMVDGQLRWRFPTTIPPRYLPGAPTGHEGPGVLPDTDQAPDASRLQPPLRLQGGTSLDLEARVSGPVTGLASSQHAVRLDLDDGGVRVAPSPSSTLNKDFVLAFTTGDPDAAAVRAWTDGAHTLVLVEPPTMALPTPLPRDAVFVVDISGSMGGTKMIAAKRALTAALHGLLPGDRFRLIAFDDRLETFAPGFVAYDERSLASADRWIDRLQARGGTEMLPAIRAALEGERSETRAMTVLFITDGQVWNESELVGAVARGLRRGRFFTLGIDTAVNASLLKRLARVGGGTCELATPSDDLEEVIARLEARFGSPVMEGVSVVGHAAARPEPAVLFAGRPAGLLVEGVPEVARVTGRTAEGAVILEATPTRVDFPLGALWARERIASLEDRIAVEPGSEGALRPEIVRLGLQHRIASRFTAFVAVERSRRVEGERVTVLQPAELPEQWDPGFLAPPPAMAHPSGLLRSSMRAPVASAPSDAMRAKGSFLGRAAKAAAAPFAAAAGVFGMGAGGISDASSAPAEPAERAAAPKKRVEEKASDPGGVLARAQAADGSFGGDVARTAAALVALVLLGNTRRSGVRRRTVIKAAQWLSAHRGVPEADLALGALEAAERGDTPAADWAILTGDHPEGRILADLA